MKGIPKRMPFLYSMQFCGLNFAQKETGAETTPVRLLRLLLKPLLWTPLSEQGLKMRHSPSLRRAR